jgi:hypothetical protein
MASAQGKETTSSEPDPAREFLEFWKHYFEQSAIQTRILFEGMQGGKSLDQAHNQWLGTLSESFESFMRTPAFLEMLKQTLKRMVELKQLQDQATKSIVQQTGLPLAADVTGVFERIQSAEQTILRRLAALDDRLKVIETTLGSAPAERNTRRGEES